MKSLAQGNADSDLGYESSVELQSPHPVQEDVCIFQTEHSESVVVEMKTTVNDKSDEVIRLLIDPRRDLSNPEEQTVSSPSDSQEIIDLCEPTSEEDQVFS